MEDVSFAEHGTEGAEHGTEGERTTDAGVPPGLFLNRLLTFKDAAFEQAFRAEWAAERAPDDIRASGVLTAISCFAWLKLVVHSGGQFSRFSQASAAAETLRVALPGLCYFLLGSVHYPAAREKVMVLGQVLRVVLDVVFFPRHREEHDYMSTSLYLRANFMMLPASFALNPVMMPPLFVHVLPIQALIFGVAAYQSLQRGGLCDSIAVLAANPALDDGQCAGMLHALGVTGAVFTYVALQVVAPFHYPLVYPTQVMPEDPCRGMWLAFMVLAGVAGLALMYHFELKSRLLFLCSSTFPRLEVSAASIPCHWIMLWACAAWAVLMQLLNGSDPGLFGQPWCSAVPANPGEVSDLNSCPAI